MKYFYLHEICIRLHHDSPYVISYEYKVACFLIYAFS